MPSPTAIQARVVVGDGGKIELLLPELRPGETVDVSVERSAPRPKGGKRPMGVLKGKVHMADDFDEPLEEFADYT